MRTTLNIDANLISTAKRMAAARAVSIGDIISELAYAGIEAQSAPMLKNKSGFPVFRSKLGAPMIGLEDVKRDDDYDGAR